MSQSFRSKSLKEGDNLWVPDRKTNGTVVKNCAPRSYIVQTDNQETYRRNRKMLVPLSSDGKTVKPNVPITPNISKPLHRPVITIPIGQHLNTGQSENNQFTQTKSGRVSKPPEHFTSKAM